MIELIWVRTSEDSPLWHLPWKYGLACGPRTFTAYTQCIEVAPEPICDKCWAFRVASVLRGVGS